MRRFSLIFLVLLLCQLTNGQNLTVRYQSGGVPVNMTTSNITSDFGRRHSVWGTSWSPSPWHMGVDFAFTGCNGIPIISITSGRVSRIENLNPSGTTHYKILTIDGGTWSDASQNATFADNTNDFGYGHIFNDNDIGNGILSGNFVFLRMDGNNSNRFAILNLNVTPHFAIGEVEGTVTYNGNPYNVRTRVDGDQLIAPIGGSGGFSQHPHLHLYRPLNPDNNVQTLSNAKNPFEVIQHPVTAYTATISELYQLTNSTATSPVWYACSDQTTNSAIKVNVSMIGAANGLTYTNSAYDIEDVRLLIKKSYEADNDYRLIKGKAVESRITMGGRRNSSRYPADGEAVSAIDIAWKSGDGTPFNGSNTNTGIEPHAYHDGNHDIFYFADIYTRIHKNQVQGVNQQLKLAPVGKLARYPDGMYNIKARATRLTNNTEFNSAVSSVIIDNFMPYVEKFEILNNGLKYKAEWIPTADEAYLELFVTDNGQLSKCYPTTIQITFSEPMKNVTVKIGLQALSFTSNTSKTTWYYEIPAFNSMLSINHLNIYGNDLAGSRTFQIPQTITPPFNNPRFSLTQFPVRIPGLPGMGSYFSNSGYPQNETNYSITFSAQKDGTGCTTYPGNIPNANFIYQASSSNPNEITFTNTTINGEAYYWEFGNGQTSSVPNPGTIEYAIQQESETYTVKLTAYGINGVVSTKTKSIYIPGFNSNSSIVISAYHTPTTVLNKIRFDCNVSGGVSGRYNITMHYGDGNTMLYTNSLGWEQWDYQYNTPALATTYNPFVVVEELNEYGLVISEKYYQLMWLDVGPEEIDDLEISINMVDSNNNPILNLLIDRNFKFKASCSNYNQALTWQWVIYNTNIPNATTMQCQPENGCKVFWGNAANSHTTPTINAFTQAGTYLAQLTVSGGIYNKTIDILIDVKAGSSCVFTRAYSIGSVSTVAKGSNVCFRDMSTITYNGTCWDTYKGIPKKEWFVNNVKKLTLQSCAGYRFYNLNFNNTPFETLNYNLCQHDPLSIFWDYNISGFFKYKFDSPGLFDIKLKAYAGVWEGGSEIYLKPQENIFNTSIVKLKVVDCDETLAITSSSQLKILSENGVIKSGNIIFDGSLIANANRMELLAIEAYSSIVIKPGFSTYNDSKVQFKIIPSPPLINCTSNPVEPCKNNSMVLDINALEPKGINIYPNPTDGYFRVELTETVQIKKVEVVNSLGKFVDLRENVNSTSCELSIADEPDGLFIVRIYPVNGEVINAKVVKSTGSRL